LSLVQGIFNYQPASNAKENDQGEGDWANDHGEKSGRGNVALPTFWCVRAAIYTQAGAWYLGPSVWSIADQRAKIADGRLFGGCMRAVVTGGAGFLGSHLCDRLIAEGWDVLSLDNLVTGVDSNIAHLQKHPRFRIARADVSNYIDVAGPIDYVLHFASPASPVDYLKMPIQTLKVGALGTHNALGLALAKNAKFFLASTSECYGDPEVSPQPETYWGHVNSIGPRGVYDEAKRYAEAMTMAYHRYHGVDTRIVRIFNTYGPRMRLNDGRALPNFVHQALTGNPLTVYGDGKQTRSFCYVSDLIDGIYRLMLSDEHLPVNIGNPQEITILQFAERIRAHFENAPKIIFEPLPQDDPKQRCPDITKAKSILGWEPKIGLDDGLRTTLDYFKEYFSSRQAASV
jgi:dTDP-glucose 4,6-dehydratase